MSSRGWVCFVLALSFVFSQVAQASCQVVKAKGVMNCTSLEKCYLVIYPQTVRQRNVSIQTNGKELKKYSIWNKMSVELTAERRADLKLLALPKLIDGSKLYKEQPFTALEDQSCGS